MSSNYKYKNGHSIVVGTIFSILLFSSLLSAVTADVDGSMISVSNDDEFTFEVHTYQVKLISDTDTIETNVFNLTDNLSVSQGELFTLKIVDDNPEMAGVDAPGRTEDMVVTGCEEDSYCIGVEWSSGGVSEAAELSIGNSVGNEDHFVASTDWVNQKLKKESEIAYTVDQVGTDGGSFAGTYDDSGDNVIIVLIGAVSGSDGSYNVSQTTEQHYQKATGVLQHFIFNDTTTFIDGSSISTLLNYIAITRVGYSVPGDDNTESSSASETSDSNSETSSTSESDDSTSEQTAHTSESDDEGFLNAPFFVGLFSISILVVLNKKKH